MDAKQDSVKERIAASIEDVETLLADNRHLSIAFLARRIRDVEDDVRKRFQGLRCPCNEVKAASAAIEKLDKRLDQAAVKLREYREELDKLKATNGVNSR